MHALFLCTHQISEPFEINPIPVFPILSFVGGCDQVVDPAVCRSVADYHDNTRIVEFEAAGHAPQIEESEGYHEALIAFLNENL